jgi:hypothetical protein
MYVHEEFDVRVHFLVKEYGPTLCGRSDWTTGQAIEHYNKFRNVNCKQCLKLLEADNQNS